MAGTNEKLDILFKNITVLTMNPDSGGPLLKNACVGVKEGVIACISAENAAPPAARIIDGARKVLMPGLYNCHTHVPMSLLRGLGNDLNLEDWLFNHIFPAEKKLTADIVYTGALLSIAEMIASGTVAFTDMYFYMDSIARAAYESGVKANLSNAVIAFDKDTYDFYQDKVYTETLNVLRDYHNAAGGRIKAEASIHGVYTSYAPAWAQVLAFAHEKKTALHVHLSETKTEHENCIKAYGLTPAQVFEKHNFFGLKTTAAHCVWATDGDIDILARHGVSAAHCPVSNLKLASGVAPIVNMLKKGVNVTLGTDGMASNNSHDLFEEIKLASILQKYASNDPTALPAMETLKLATVNGAKAQGRENESGMIKTGFDADIIMLDFDTPRQSACYDEALNLAYSVTGRDVVMTLCKGKILYENGEYTTIDIEKLLHEARKVSSFVK